MNPFRLHSTIIISFGLLAFQCTRNQTISPITLHTGDQTISLSHKNIRMEFDDQMFCKVYYLDDIERSINDPSLSGINASPSHFIKLNDTFFKRFKVTSHKIELINDTHYGSGKKLTIKGILSGIEKTLFIEMYDKFPDLAVSWCSYTNRTEESFKIDGIYYNYYRLDRKLTSPESESFDFRYLQPLNKSWGNTWSNIGLTDSTSEDFIVPGSGSNRSGIPFIDVWGREMGMAVFHVEGIPRFIHIILQVKNDNKVDMGLKVCPEDSYGQFPAILGSNEKVVSWKSAACVHKNDFFDPGRRFGQLLDGALKKEGREGLIRNYPSQAYEPYWKTWGMNNLGGSGEFTIDEVTARMDELADYGFKAIMLDDGWFDHVGVWNPHPGKFDDEEDLMDFVREAHMPQWGSNKDKSFKVYLWFDLLGANQTDGKDHLLVRNRDGSLYQSAQSKYAYCPSCKQFNDYIRDTLLEKIINKWDIDGLYTDWEDQNPLPCFAVEHNHAYEAESVENNYLAFKTMYDKIMGLKPETGWVAMCACASVHDSYQYPYYFLGDASDPVNNQQVRWRTKWIKAFRGSTVPAGDGYVDKMNYDNKAGEPAMSVATGCVITSLRWKVNELGGEDHICKWMKLYNTEKLYDGEYLGLYDIEYHKPEGYVIKKDDGLFYYAFFDEKPFDKEIEIRGLEANTLYKVVEYDTGNEIDNVKGPNPVIHIHSKPGNNAGEQVFYYVFKCVSE